MRAVVVGDRRIHRLAWSSRRARRASRRRFPAPAEWCVGGGGNRVGRQVALGSQPSGRSLSSSEGVGTSTSGAASWREPRRSTVGPRVRCPPEVDVGDPQSERRFQGAVGRRRSPRRTRWPAPSGARRVGTARPAVLFHDRDPVAHLDRLVDVDDGLTQRRLRLWAWRRGTRSGASRAIGHARKARPSAHRRSTARAGRRRRAAAGRRTAARVAVASSGRGRPGRAARWCGRGSAPCPSRAAAARWRCSDDRAVRKSPTCWISSDFPAASPRRGTSPTRRDRMSPRQPIIRFDHPHRGRLAEPEGDETQIRPPPPEVEWSTAGPPIP